MSLGSPADTRLSPATPAASDRGDPWRWLPYAVALGLTLLVHGGIILFDRTPALDGVLSDTDAYMRLVRVTQLFETGDWFDQTIARSNAPEGSVMHWTRPMDVLLLAGAWGLSPWFAFDQGLLWWAVFVSPVLHLAMVIALVWATAPLLDPWRRCLLVLAVLTQPPLTTAGIVGHTDHHMLIILSFVVAIGLHLRLLLRPFTVLPAVAAGASLGFALWLSIEGLILIALSFAAVTVAWILRGGDRVRKNLWHALGLAAMVAVALAVERPPSAYLLAEYDRISVVHLTVGALAVGFWFAAAGLEARGPGEAARGRRAATAAVGACVCAVLLYAVYPKFFGGPEVEVDPRVGPVFYDFVFELRPLVPRSLYGLGDFMIHLGPALVALPFLGWLLWQERRQATWDGWLYLAICLGAFVLLAVAMRRFAFTAEVLQAIVIAELLARLIILSERVTVVLARVVLRSGLMLGLLLGSILIGSLLSPPAAKGEWGPSCSLARLAGFLDDPAGLGARPLVILAHFNHGPELLYRTRHAVVAAPYHRDVDGLAAADTAFGAPDDELSRRVIERRGVDLLLFCRRGPAMLQASFKGGSTFVDRLSKGQVPAWLEPVRAPDGSIGDFLVFRVLR